MTSKVFWSIIGSVVELLYIVLGPFESVSMNSGVFGFYQNYEREE
jgi:hypothetical protein